MSAATGSRFDAKALARSSTWATAAHAVHLASRLLLTPMIVACVGLEAYGFWSLAFVMMGWIGLQRSGFLSAAVPLVSEALGSDDHDRAAETLKAAATLSLFVSTAAFALVWWGRGAFISALGVPADLVSDANLSLLIIIAATGAALTLGGFQSYLEARNQFPTVKAIETGAALTESALLLILLSAGWGLVGLATAYALRILGQVSAYWFMAAPLMVGRGPWPGVVSRATVQPLFRLGASLQGIGFLHLTIAACERLFIVHFLGLAGAGVFELARKLINFGSGLVAQGLGPMTAAVARFRSDESRDLRGLLERAHRYTTYFGALPLIGLLVLPELIFVVWLRELPPHGVSVLRVLSLAAYFHLATGPWTAGWRGQARPGNEIAYALLWCASLLILVPPLQRLGGTSGLLAAVALAQGSASLFLLFRAGRSFCGGALPLLRSTLLPLASAFVPALVVGSFALQGADLSSRMKATPWLLGSGSVLVASYLVISWRWTLQADDRRQMKAFFYRWFPRTREPEECAA